MSMVNNVPTSVSISFLERSRETENVGANQQLYKATHNIHHISEHAGLSHFVPSDTRRLTPYAKNMPYARRCWG